MFDMSLYTNKRTTVYHRWTTVGQWFEINDAFSTGVNTLGIAFPDSQQLITATGKHNDQDAS